MHVSARVMPSPTDANNDQWTALRKEWWAVALVLLAGLIAHGWALGRGFVWDDAMLRADLALRGHWRLFEPDIFGFVRPVKVLVFSLLDSFFGHRAALWEAVALLVHLGVGAFAYRFSRLFLPPGWAAAAAALFVVHPLHVEATFWMAAFNGTIMLVPALLYLLLHAKNDPATPRTIALSLGLGTAAVLSREDAAVLPILATILMVALGRIPSRNQLFLFALQLAISATLLVLSRMAATQASQALDPLPHPQWVLASCSPGTVLMHCAIFFSPWHWWFYTRPLDSAGLLVGLTILACLLGALAGGRILMVRKVEPLLALVAMAVVAIAPMANVIGSGNSLVGVRYLSLAGVFLAIVTMTIVGRIGERSRPLGVASAAIAFLLCAGSSFAYHRHWRSDQTFFQRMTEALPDEPLMHQRLVAAHLEARDVASAEAASREAMGRHPEATSSWLMQGVVLQRQGRYQEAGVALSRAVELDPGNLNAHLQLGNVLEMQFQQTQESALLEAAAKHYREATRLGDYQAETAYINLGTLYATTGRIAAAVEVWEEGLRRFPGSRDLRTNLGIARKQLSAR